MFDILAIDWGHKRCGIALGSTHSFLAIPYDQEVFQNSILNHIDTICEKNPIKTILIGLPSNALGGDTHITEQIREFANSLQTTKYSSKYNIRFIDERFTTKDAHIFLKETGIKRDAPKGVTQRSKKAVGGTKTSPKNLSSLSHREHFKHSLNHLSALALMQKYLEGQNH